MRARCLLFLVAATLVFSCKSRRVGQPQTLEPVSAEEADAVAKWLASSLANCDAPELAMIFDRQWIFQTIARASALGPEEQYTLYRALGARENFEREFLCASDVEPAYLGLRQTAEGQSLLFRATDEAGPNYWEFPVGKGRGGAVRCVGRLDYREGWPLRDVLTIRSNPQALAEALARMRENLADSPESVRQDAEKYSDVQIAQALLVRAAARQGEGAYREALARYLQRFPHDASIYLQVYEDLASAGLYALADEAIVALQEAVNDADGLLSKRVALLLEAGEFARATKLAEDGLVAHPDEQEAHYRLLEALVESRNFGGAVAVMRLMGERFNMRFTEESMDTSHPAYVELLASDAWSAY